jgi:uncharacterized iron-regulated membrane protein
LWIVIPIVLAAGSGVLLVFGGPVSHLIGAEKPQVPKVATLATPRVGSAEAIEIAVRRAPRAQFSALSLPAPGKPWYRVRLRMPGEIPRMWGASLVYVSALDGSILADQPAQNASRARAFMQSLYPLHTGQIGGLAGRVTLFVSAAGLGALIVLGWMLWRRRSQAAACRADSAARP